MAEYVINIVLGFAGLIVVLLMNLVIIKKVYSHRNQFTGLLSGFYKKLSLPKKPAPKKLSLRNLYFTPEKDEVK